MEVECRVWNIETRMSPRKQQVDALFGDEVPVSKQSQNLMTKDQLGFVGVDIGDGEPLPVREENPAGNDGVDVGIPFQRRSKCLDDSDHTWPGVGLLDGASHHRFSGDFRGLFPRPH